MESNVPGMEEQCAWCGYVSSGPYAGMPVFEERNGKVRAILFEGYTHGICSVCEAVLRARHLLKKAERVTWLQEDAILRIDVREWGI